MTREEQLKREYERKLSALREEQRKCRHEWGKAKYDPEIKQEPYGFVVVGHGSDIWTEPQGYHDVEYKRWSRTCTICGKVEYTKEMEPEVPIKYVPKFSS